MFRSLFTATILTIAALALLSMSAFADFKVMSSGSVYSTLSDAVSNAQSTDEIRISSGAYTISGSTVTLAKNLTIIGGCSASYDLPVGTPAENDTVLDGSGTSPSRPLLADGGVILELKNLTMKNANTTTGGRGGFIHVINQTKVTFTNCHFSNNYNNDRGGAVNATQGHVYFVNCTLHDNTAFVDTVAQTGGRGTVSSAGASASNINCTVSFDGCDIYNNTTGDRGSAVYFAYTNFSAKNTKFRNNKQIQQNPPVTVATLGGGSSFIVEDCEFIDNRDYAVSSNSPLTLRRCLFDGNYALNTSGGMWGWNVELWGGGVGVIEDCTFKNGAQGIVFYGPGTTHSATRCSIENFVGTGIETFDKCTSVITDCVVKNMPTGFPFYIHNKAQTTLLRCASLSNTNYGIRIENPGVNLDGCIADVVNCVFTGNQDGGVIVEGYSFVKLLNCLIADNSSAFDNGGVIMFDRDGVGPSVDIINCTIANNTSNSFNGGGGILATNSTAVLKNSIVWGNTCLNGAQEINGFGNGVFASITGDYNIIKNAGENGDDSTDVSGYNIGLGGGSHWNAGPHDLMNVDPLLDPSYHLMAGSPAINAGDDAVATWAKDNDGDDRIQGSAVDIGADETNEGSVLTIIGKVVLEDIIGQYPSYGYKATLKIYKSGNSNCAAPDAVKTVSLDANGNYSFTVAPQGAGCTVVVKAGTQTVQDPSVRYHFLAKKLTGVDLSGNAVLPTVNLPNGDANDDNIVDAFDFTILMQAYDIAEDTTLGETDLTNDGTVDAFDFTILMLTYDTAGDDCN